MIIFERNNMAMTSKLAGLPGIAYDEPDMYETSGTGERDKPMNIHYDMSSNENIDRFSIDAANSYSKFKGKSVPVSSIDFSDSVIRERNHGYVGGNTFHDAVGEGLLDETLQDRYDRIQRDLRALEADFLAVSTQQKLDDSFLQGTDVDFASKIGDLKEHLNNLDAVKDLPRNHSVRKEVSRSRNLGDGDASSSLSGANTDTNLEQAAVLETRLKKLEQAFGSDRDLATVTMLKNQMSLLDKDNLDQIESRLQQFLPKLNQAVEKLSQAHAPDGEMDKKINEAHAMLKGWTKSIDKVQTVVDRLVALKAVHEQASAYVQHQEEVERIQKQLLAKMDDLEQQTKMAQDYFSQALATITRDIGQLETRIK